MTRPDNPRSGTSRSGGRKPTICLCMIVKDEAKVIERCLGSVRDLIDTWVISDTGSTDGTQELIRRALDGIPGELHEEPWTNFGHNRTLNIRHARGKADYLLLIDADMVVRQEGRSPRRRPIPTCCATPPIWSTGSSGWSAAPSTGVTRAPLTST